MRNIIIILIAFIIGLGVGLIAPKPEFKGEYQIDRITSKTDTFIIKKDSLITKTNLKFIHDTTINVPDKIDTQAILRQFYSTNYYSDSVALNNNYALIYDTISQNKILNRSVKFHLEEKFITKTDSIFLKEKFKPYLFLGGNYNLTQNKIGMNIGYQFRNFNVYTGYNNGINVGFNIKIH